MQELVHHSRQTLELHLDQLNKVQELYMSKSFDFDAYFDAFLHSLLDYFKAKGNTTYESEVLKIMSMISTVKRGFNPVKLEKVNFGKRDLVSGFSFSGMENIHGLLTDLLSKEQRKLDEAEELLSASIGGEERDRNRLLRLSRSERHSLRGVDIVDARNRSSVQGRKVH